MESDVGVAVGLKSSLALAVTVAKLGPSLDGSKVISDVGAEVMDIIVLYIDIVFLELREVLKSKWKWYQPKNLSVQKEIKLLS